MCRLRGQVLTDGSYTAIGVEAGPAAPHPEAYYISQSYWAEDAPNPKTVTGPIPTARLGPTPESEST